MKIALLAPLASLLLAGFVPSSTPGAQVPAPIPLWPGTAPGDTGDLGPEKDTTGPKDGLVAGRPLIRLGNVSEPTITLFAAPRTVATGAAVVVCPGGGYHILAMDLEGTEVAAWLNSIGVAAVVLKYRVPARKNRERYEAPLQDAQRALGLVRSRAREWGLDPGRIGILGFSAGAHLAAVASCNYDHRRYDKLDPADQESCRPDFALLIYPAYLTVEKEADKIAPELKITTNTPPTFLVQTEDDSVRVENSLSYYLGLKKLKVPAELHVYASGGHGYGLRPTKEVVTAWPQRAEQWMRGLGLLETAK